MYIFYVVPEPKSYILISSIPENSSNNSDENSDGETLNIAGKSTTRFLESEPLTTLNI